MLLLYGVFVVVVVCLRRDLVINHWLLLNILVSLVKIKSDRNEA